jgi:site-specific DNA-cytosine methylase
VRFVSLFSGIEAASAAWAPLGWECAAVAEIEPFPCAVLAHHYPGVPNLGDVTKISEKAVRALGPIDVVVAGFPCQDVSIAGKRKGFKNADGSATRSGLFWDAMRFVQRARQFCGLRWLVLENVPGLFSSHAGRDFGAVVGAMAGCGFDVPRDGWRSAGCAAGPHGLVEWSVLDAQFRGLAQRRKRVFLVADFGDWAGRPPVLLERESMLGDPAPGREARKGSAGGAGGGVKDGFITGPLDNRADGGGAGWGTDWMIDGGLTVAGTLEGGGDAKRGGGHRWGTDFLANGGLTVANPIRVPSHGAAWRADGSDNFTVADPISASEAKTYSHEGRGNFRPHNLVGDVGVHNNTGQGWWNDAETASPLRDMSAGTGSTEATLVSSVARCLNGHGGGRYDGESETFLAVAHTLTGEGFDASEDGTSRGPPLVVADFLETDNDVRHGKTTKTDAVEALRALRDSVDPQTLSEWGSGVLAAFWPQEVLRSGMHGQGLRRPPQPERGLVNVALSCAETGSRWSMRDLWEAGCDGCPSPGWRPSEQLAGKLGAYLSRLPYSPSPAERLLHDLWEACDGSRLLRQTLSKIQEVRRSACVQTKPAHASAVRRLTPEEAEALQGFPRGYTNVPFRGKCAADGPRYKSLGNSFAVPVIRWIGERLEAVG